MDKKPLKETLYGFKDPDEAVNNELTEEEEAELTKLIDSEIEKPVHLLFKTIMRFNTSIPRLKKSSTDRDTYLDNCAVVLTPHFIYLYQKKKKVYGLFLQVFIGDVTLIAYSPDNLVLIQTKETNIILNSETNLKFAQLLYRNYQLCFPRIPLKQKVRVNCEDMSLFPELEIPLSPSQEFQFTYLSACAHSNIAYNHEVVRYVHTLICSQNTIIDLSQLPFDFNNPASVDAITPVFNTLGEIGFLSGICCSNIHRPDILEMMALFVKSGSNFRIVHFENCGITSGFLKLSQVSRSNPKFNVSYWNLKGNQNIQDIYYFPEVLSYNSSPLILLNLSDLNLKPTDAANIFETLGRNPLLQVIKHLSLAGFPFQDPNVQNKIDAFLRASASENNLRIESLELDHLAGSNIDIAFKLFTSQNLPLRILKVNGNKFTYKSVEYIIYIVKHTKTLQELDLSDTDCSPENILRIVQAISENKNIQAIRLLLNGLKIGGDNLLSVMKAFLSTDREKWRSLAFDRNGLTCEDLKATVAFLKRMPKLKELSLSGNFNFDNKNIGETLLQLLNIKSLKRIIIRGSEQHRLQKEIYPLLTSLATFPQLKKLDITGQHAGNDSISLITSIIRQCKQLKELEIDMNKFNAFESFTDLIQAVQENSNLITFHYPIMDAKAYVDSLKKKDQESMIKTISDQQVTCQTYININRAKKKIPAELPFIVTQDIAKLISEISNPETKRIHDSKLLKHSLACEIMHVPLPFQSGMLEESDDRVKLIENGSKMQVYDTPSLMKYYEEDNTNMQALGFTATVNPQFTTLFNNDANITQMLNEQHFADQNPQQFSAPPPNNNNISNDRQRVYFPDPNQPPLPIDLNPPNVQNREIEEPKEEPSKKKMKEAPPLKKKQVLDKESKSLAKKRKHRFRPSSSSSEEEDEDYAIQTKRITKQDLRRVIDIIDSDSSSSYDEPEILPEERAPKFKRKEIVDEPEADPKPKPRKKPTPQKRKMPQNTSSSSDSDPFPHHPKQNQPPKRKFSYSSSTHISSKESFSKQNKQSKNIPSSSSDSSSDNIDNNNKNYFHNSNLHQKLSDNYYPSSSSSDDDDDQINKPKVNPKQKHSSTDDYSFKPNKRSKQKPIQQYSNDDNDDNDDNFPKKQPSFKPQKNIQRNPYNDDNDSSYSNNQLPKHQMKPRNSKPNKFEFDDDSDDDDEVPISPIKPRSSYNKDWDPQPKSPPKPKYLNANKPFKKLNISDSSETHQDVSYTPPHIKRIQNSNPKRTSPSRILEYNRSRRLSFSSSSSD